ncbi:MAG: Acyl-CoA dehydrogenase, partial [uncultured Solirubrobacteraceae bacterium]
GLRPHPPLSGALRAPGGLHGHPGPAGRGGVRARAGGVGRSQPPPGRHGGAQGRGQVPGPVEPLPPPRGVGRRPDEPRVRAARGDLGPVAHRPGGHQLQRAGHGEHGGADALRHPGPAGALAAPAPGRRDPLDVLHDRAGRGVLGRHEHRALHRARRGRVRPERAQVVGVGRAAPQLPDPHRDGQDGSRGADPPPAEHDPRPARPPGRRDRPPAARLRLPGPGGPRRAALRGRPRPGGEPRGRRGRRLPHLPGAARPGADPPLHADGRRRGARARAHVPAGRGAHDLRPARRVARERPGLDRGGPDRDRDAPPARAQDRLAHGHRGQQARPHGDRRHQGGGPDGRAEDHRPRDPGPRRRRGLGRRAAREHVRPHAHAAPGRRPRRGAQDDHRPPRAAPAAAGQPSGQRGGQRRADRALLAGRRRQL